MSDSELNGDHSQPSGIQYPVGISRPDHSLPVSKPVKRYRFIKITFILLVLLGVFCLICDPVSWLLNAILVYETPQKPTGIVLVGSLGSSLETAATLYKEGTVKSILITEGVPDRYAGIDAPLHLNYFIRRDLLAAGIPNDRIFSLERQPTSMLERQQMLKRWVRENSIRSYTVFSGRYNSRMVKMLHDDTFPDDGIELVIYPSDGNYVWRKQILGIHNTLVRMIYWYTVYRPRINN